MLLYSFLISHFSFPSPAYPEPLLCCNTPWNSQSSIDHHRPPQRRAGGRSPLGKLLTSLTEFSTRSRPRGRRSARTNTAKQDHCRGPPPPGSHVTMFAFDLDHRPRHRLVKPMLHSFINELKDGIDCRNDLEPSRAVVLSYVNGRLP